jgi:hypothetical protein
LIRKDTGGNIRRWGGVERDYMGSVYTIEEGQTNVTVKSGKPRIKVNTLK